MKKLLIFYLNFFLFTFSFLLSAPEAQAQALSLGIWPPLLEVMIQPGRSITQVYKISNPGEGDLILTSNVVPFVPADELGNVAFTSEVKSADTSEVFNWFTFQNADLQLGEKFVLRASREQEVVLRIKIPENAHEDDYYYTLLFETVPNPFWGGQSSAQAQAKIGANILLTVSKTGEPQKQAKIKQFSLANSQLSIINYQFIDSFDKPEFLLRLQNTGKAFFKPMGTITVSGGLGPLSGLGQKFVLNLLPENVLTNSIRQISCQKDGLASPCRLPGKFLLGQYTARLESGLDKTSSEYQKEIIFWAIPIKLALGILTALVLLVIIKSKG